jgi:hypothetical protein
LRQTERLEAGREFHKLKIMFSIPSSVVGGYFIEVLAAKWAEK